MPESDKIFEQQHKNNVGMLKGHKATPNGQRWNNFCDKLNNDTRL